MTRVIRWQLQHGFHDEWIFYSSYGEVQGRATSTCWILGYAIIDAPPNSLIDSTLSPKVKTTKG